MQNANKQENHLQKYGLPNKCFIVSLICFYVQKKFKILI